MKDLIIEVKDVNKEIKNTKKYLKYCDSNNNIRIALPKSVGQGLGLARTYKISELQCIDRGRQL